MVKMMSRRQGKGMRNKGEKPEKRPPSHVALEAIQSMTNVMMCRSCGMKMFCPSPMQCRMEAILEAKIAMLTDRMGEEEVRKLTPPELVAKMREIPDEDTLKFMEGVLEDVELDKEPLQEGETGAGDIQDTQGDDDGVREAEHTEPVEQQNGEDDS